MEKRLRRLAMTVSGCAEKALRDSPCTVQDIRGRFDGKVHAHPPDEWCLGFNSSCNWGWAYPSIFLLGFR